MVVVPQLVGLLILVGIGIFLYLRSKRGAQALGAVQPGLDALRAGFALSRSPDESEPVCVVAYHYSGLSVVQVTVGVTNRRVLVVKGAGPMQAFPYDYEGEHLPSAQKQAQKRGFFNWFHGSFKDGSKGYKPQVSAPSPFVGEEWRMYPVLPTFPEQQANLREFSNRFNFMWFY